jgi:hypothetical protein
MEDVQWTPGHHLSFVAGTVVDSMSALLDMEKLIQKIVSGFEE